MIRSVALSAFGDEIATGLADQIDILRSHQIRHIDLRTLGEGQPVLGASTDDACRLKEALRASGLAVASLASPIGKEPADVDPSQLERTLERAIGLARVLGTPWIRVFGFYPPSGCGSWGEAALRALRRLVALARDVGVTLLLENEQGTSADTLERFHDVLASVDDPHLQAVYDPANALQCGERDCLAGYEALKPWIRQLHVKDIDRNGRHVLPGQGCAGWPEILAALARDGFSGVLSLEPHLTRAGRAGGFSGPELFAQACAALQNLMATARLSPI
ncbi:MAG TPA: sugar phosphate isomerase/epimerase [Solirubrobacteraceae bacterium]|nr:sugar phosphate isomerase/epimerase [Solirubrobacteraceae bacterium]